MFTTRSRILLLACLGFMLGNTSCDEKKDDHGTLIVPFKLGNDRSCDDFNVKTVRGVLDHGDSDDDDSYSDEVKCETRELRFESVPSGSWRLRLFAYQDDDDENAVMDSLQNDDLRMNVIGDGTTVVAERKVMLTASPAHLLVRWSFGYGTCKSAGIGSFVVTVWRNDGSDLLLEDELDCEAVGDAEDGYYRKIPDEKRLLLGNDSGEVAVQPLDTDGKEIGEALSYTFKAPGPGQDVKLSLKCDEDEEVKAGVSCWPEDHAADAK
ncbi:MAG TPA: hypothetical protein VFG30_25105 [Polyangiales bacterium]|nr:hypothetical protein [Polyangiales bacterium]